MWLDLAKELDLRTTAPASPTDIALAEEAIGCALPAVLRELLEETDGLVGENGMDVVFSAQTIARENSQMRNYEGFDELYMPFDALLFFGAEGNGDLYAFRILAGRADDLHDVFVWDHETDSRTITAHGLERYVRSDRWHETEPEAPQPRRTLTDRLLRRQP